MRIFFLVLLLILNVYAEAKSSGSVSRKDKKSKSSVVVNDSAASEVDSSKTAEFGMAFVPAASDSTVLLRADNGADSLVSGEAVQDTVVDTVYVIMPESIKKKKKQPEERSIPLPHQTAYLGKGLSVGIGAGLFKASDDCDCLGVWEGQVEYHYKKFITGGIDVRFFGGTLDSDVMLMYQRYRFNARLHKAFSWIDFYASVLLGLETTDLSEFRKELEDGVLKKRNNSDSDSSEVARSSVASEDSVDVENQEFLDEENNCEKMFSLDGFTLGVEVGMGAALGRYIGLVGSASYEFNFSWAQQVTFSSGLAFNLREVWPWARKNLRSTWISFEMVFQRYFNRDVKEWAVAGFLGLQFGI